MGGGAALLAAARHSSVRAVATLAAAESDPSAIEAAAAIAAPVLFLAAADDAITPVERHQRPMFEAKASGPVQLRAIVAAATAASWMPRALSCGSCAMRQPSGPTSNAG